jgi:hypothetical protein
MFSDSLVTLHAQKLTEAALFLGGNKDLPSEDATDFELFGTLGRTDYLLLSFAATGDV